MAYSKGYYFLQKMLIFCKKNADISKIKGVLVLKVLFSKEAKSVIWFLCYLKVCQEFRGQVFSF